jgi:hypothetical protein
MSEARDAPNVDYNLEFQPIKFRREAAKVRAQGFNLVSTLGSPFKMTRPEGGIRIEGGSLTQPARPCTSTSGATFRAPPLKRGTQG